jgi:glycine dehydrogenase subunit 2
VTEPFIFELGAPGRRGVTVPACDVPERPLDTLIPVSYLREEPPSLPEVSELDVVRHFTRLSHRNFSVDTNFYPLGSCTMKYNPKMNDEMAALPGFARIHPYTPEACVQGALALYHTLASWLCEVTGMAAFTLQPSAGAHGEALGMLLVHAYHASQGRARKRVIIPESAHGTNPASAALVGYEVVEVPANARGEVDLDALRSRLNDDVAALMLTNPNTLGVFETQVEEMARLVHEAGGLVYYDGANLNAIIGTARSGDMGFDIVHLNLHKTFSTPHGGGGPGAGPVGVASHLERFLPVPVVVKEGEAYRFDFDRPDSVGRVRAFAGNMGVLVRAYAYIRSLGAEGLREVSRHAVLNANYVLSQLRDTYDLAVDRTCMHECVLSATRQAARGVRALDIAKALLDYGFHAPTIYFPHVAPEALMIEPTETETKETLDAFIAAMRAIAREAEENPEGLKERPLTTPVRRLDEVAAARKPVLKWRPTEAG